MRRNMPIITEEVVAKRCPSLSFVKDPFNESLDFLSGEYWCQYELRLDFLTAADVVVSRH